MVYFWFNHYTAEVETVATMRTPATSLEIVQVEKLMQLLSSVPGSNA